MREADERGLARSAGRIFETLEHSAHILLGLMLAVTAALAFVNAGLVLLRGVHNLSDTAWLVDVIDRLLAVFMLIEILHTVRASLRTGGLSCEPFLVVGLIASIRRVLVITLESSQITAKDGWNPQTLQMMHSSMLELGVLALLIFVMVLSIYLLHRAKPQNDDPVGLSR